jgi:hypothetical protein
MGRAAFASLAFVFVGLMSFAGHTAPATAKHVTAGKPIIFVQAPWEGWWEREHREQPAREGYWRLSPPELDRYNQLQSELDELLERRKEIDERIRDVEREQHEILGVERP